MSATAPLRGAAETVPIVLGDVIVGRARILRESLERLQATAVEDEGRSARVA
jgi:hypothetical protein